MESKNQASEKFMAFLSDIFERGVSMSYGVGEVSMCSHMLQTAFLAEKDGATRELVVASLLHDIGHFGTDFSLEFNDGRHKAMLSVAKDRCHEEAGANILESIFGADIAEPVRLHVSAKRYLCAVDPKYFGKLAETTRHTLKLQGGIMTSEEVKLFESNLHAAAAAKLRRWDDLATHQERKIPNFEHYQKLLEELL
jgi:predicted HD phosphohydrolase